MDSFGIRLKKLRKEKELTQKELAEEVGLAETTVANRLIEKERN
ncbi:MAG: helix-turn-helix transcriptional regulator [Clostridiaceae bacterium]|nr:helix-turn-helix transcriptional regulator [Clostridiaceae bacterium]